MKKYGGYQEKDDYVYEAKDYFWSLNNYCYNVYLFYCSYFINQIVTNLDFLKFVD
jgi:hypothetical protein